MVTPCTTLEIDPNLEGESGSRPRFRDLKKPMICAGRIYRMT
jgi:hypothetical protein